MKQHSIVRLLILNQWRENKKLFFVQLCWALVLGLLIHVLDRIFIFRALPVYFIFLLVSSIFFNKQVSSVVKTGLLSRRDNPTFLYNNALPLTYLQKFTISLFSSSINSFFIVIPITYYIYFLSPSFIDFSGYGHLYVFTAISCLHLFIIVTHVHQMNIIDRYTTMEAGSLENVKIIILNGIAFFGMIIIFLFDTVALKALVPVFSEYFSAFNFIVFFICVYDILLLKRIMTNSRTRNEHTSYRFVQPSLGKQLKVHAINYSYLLGFNLLLGIFVYSQIHVNLRAYDVLSEFKFIKPSYGIELLNDKPEEFVSYYRNGMPQDKLYQWFDDRFIMAAIVDNDSLDLLKELVPVPIDSYDEYFCKLNKVKSCYDGYFLNSVVRSDAGKISQYLLDNPMYDRDKKRDENLMYQAALNCNSRSLSVLIESGISTKFTKVHRVHKTAFDILAYKNDKRCRLTMRDLLKSI